MLRMSRVLLEICIASPEDAATAAAGGADRLELNSALELGGLTPSLGTLLETRNAARLPVITMVRPRPGGFHYSAAAFKTMCRDVDLLLENGADGIAFGILMGNGSIDMARCRQFIARIGTAGARQFVFHRAFDFTPDPIEALEQLIDLGFRRVMTSGQQPTALDGADLIAELIRRSAGRIEVLPASGIRPTNVAEVVSRTKCSQVHASLRGMKTDSSLNSRPRIHLNGSTSSQQLDVEGYQRTDAGLVTEMVNALGAVPHL
jgi:copper homeostasis protein